MTSSRKRVHRWRTHIIVNSSWMTRLRTVVALTRRRDSFMAVIADAIPPPRRFNGRSRGGAARRTTVQSLEDETLDARVFLRGQHLQLQPHGGIDVDGETHLAGATGWAIDNISVDSGAEVIRHLLSSASKTASAMSPALVPALWHHQALQQIRMLIADLFGVASRPPGVERFARRNPARGLTCSWTARPSAVGDHGPTRR